MRAVPVLVILNVLVFLLVQMTPRSGWRAIYGEFALSASGLEMGRWWEYFTHAFMHGGSPFLLLNVAHLVLNMAGLWFFGRIVERVMGTGRFVVLYLGCAVAGGLAQVLATGGVVPLVGASGAVCGVVVAFATLFPNARRVVLVFFVIPVTMRAKYLGWLVVGLSMAFLVTGWLPMIGHAAHLGGGLAGFFLTRLAGYGVPFGWEGWLWNAGYRQR